MASQEQRRKMSALAFTTYVVACLLAGRSPAERVGRKAENHGSKPTTISVFRGKAILAVFSIRVRVTEPNPGQIWPDQGVQMVRKSWAIRGISVE